MQSRDSKRPGIIDLMQEQTEPRYCDELGAHEWTRATRPVSHHPARLFVRLQTGSFAGVIELVETGVDGSGRPLESELVGRITLDLDEARWLRASLDSAIGMLEAAT